MREISEDGRNLEGDSGRRHSPVTRSHFFKIFLPMYLEELPIPRKFVQKYRKELSDIVILKGPRGTVWRVGLKETDGIMYFLNGWKEFTEHHSLCIGYLLVFRYDGNSQFNVQIFDKSACEKEYPYASENYEESCSNKGSCTPEKGSNDSIGIKREGRDVHLTERSDNNLVFPNIGSCTPEKESEDSIEILRVCRMEDLHPIAKRNNRHMWRSSLRDRFQSNAMKMKKLNCETMSKNNNQQKNRTNELRQSESRSSTSGMSVGSKNLQQAKPQDHLLSSQQSGHIRSIQSNGEKLVESIHKNVSNCSKEKTHSETIPIALKNQSTESCMPLSGENFSVKPENQQTEPDGISSSSDDTEYSQKQRESIMPANGRFHGRLVSKRRKVSAEQKRKALLEATKFKSNNPFFSAIMRASYVNRSPRMHIPLNFVKDHFPSRPTHVTLESSHGQKWPIGCRYRKNGTLLLSRGWARFLAENKIEEGDVCVFELVKRKNVRLKVIIYRVDDMVPLIHLKLAAKKRRCK